MLDRKQLIVSHAPFLHDRSGISERSVNMLIAALPAVIMGIIQYGAPALGVVSISISSAMLWEYLFNRISKSSPTIGDGNAAVIGIVFAMMLPATVPWWFVITGTFIAVVIGKMIFGGIGGNPVNPVALSIAIILLSWEKYLNFNGMLVNYDLNFAMIYPIEAARAFGPAEISFLTPADLLMGRQIGGLGATFGLGLLAGGIYLMIRGFVRWEISLSFLLGIFAAGMLFHAADPAKYAGPLVHLLCGYTLLGAFFLLPEDSSSPVNTIPMLIFGLAAGLLTVLIRNIGAWADGVVFAVLIVNLTNPLLDAIRPKALGRVM